MQGRHICIVTSVHPLDDVRVKTKFVNSLLESGWKVSWVGPGSAVGDISDAIDPRVVYSLVPKPTGRVGRLRAARPLYAAAKSAARVDWWYSPDPDAIRVALRLARDRGGRTVFDIHEVFHTGHLDQWTRGHRVQLISNFVKRRIEASSQQSDLVVGVSEGVLDHYSGALARPALVVRNCAPRSFAESRGEMGSRSGFRVMHGKMARGNGTAQVLQALCQLETSTGVTAVMFESPESNALLQGNAGPLRPHVSIEQLARIRHEEMPDLTRGCDLGIISYQRDLGTESMPNRIFEYMAAGIAVLVPSYSKDLSKLVSDERIGLSCDFESPPEIAKALDWAAEHPTEVQAMGARAKKAFVERHCWDTEFKRFEERLTNFPSGQK